MAITLQLTDEEQEFLHHVLDWHLEQLEDNYKHNLDASEEYDKEITTGIEKAKNLLAKFSTKEGD